MGCVRPGLRPGQVEQGSAVPLYFFTFMPFQNTTYPLIDFAAGLSGGKLVAFHTLV